MRVLTVVFGAFLERSCGHHGAEDVDFPQLQLAPGGDPRLRVKLGVQEVVDPQTVERLQLLVGHQVHIWGEWGGGGTQLLNDGENSAEIQAQARMIKPLPSWLLQIFVI